MNNIKVSFSGHDKFDCKLDWIIKGISEISNNKDALSIKSVENIELAIEKLGLGINMIKSLKHWLTVFNLVENNSLSDFGKTILEFDPYLETTDVFWLLHWNLIKNKKYSTIYFLFFTEFYPNRFTSEGLMEKLIEWINKNQINLSKNTIKSDVDVFIRMYMGIFKDLDIIHESNQEYFLNFNNKKNISDKAFLSILVDYIDNFNKDFDSISLEELQIGKTSLQKILCMNESDFMNRIHNIDSLSNGNIKYSDNAGYRKLNYQNYNKPDLLKDVFA